MAKQVATMNLKGNAYAKVATRTKEFWQDHPNGKIEPVHKTLGDGTIEAKAFIWKDKAEFLDLLKSGATPELAMLSADASGSAQASAQAVQAAKGFEKLETIAVGRALGLLGYLANGEVATSEEMEAFEEYKREQDALAIEKASKEMASTSTMEELKALWIKLPVKVRQNREIEAFKNQLKEKLEKGDAKDGKADEEASNPAE